MDYHTKERQGWLGASGRDDWKGVLAGTLFLLALIATTVDWNSVLGYR